MSDPSDLTPEQARVIILDICETNGWIQPQILESQRESGPDGRAVLNTLQRLRRTHGDAIETISQDIYSGSNRFILELIQNAEDCTFTSATNTPYISFELTQHSIVVECNEKGFTETDIRQICHTGRSWKKKRPGYIGEKGIGFKAVFKVASKVHIQSNAFAFSFEYDRGPMATGEANLGMVTPIPEDDPIPQHERPLTRKTLTLNDNTSFNDLIDHLQAIPESLLLFLHKLREIKIAIDVPDQELSGVNIFRKSIDNPNGITSISKLSEPAHTVDEWRYRVFKTMATDLPNVPARRVSEDSNDYYNESEIVLAFPIAADEGGLPRIFAQHDVFAFLPVCNVGFNFLIQADFLLQANREDVIIDSPWNKAIVDHVVDAFCDAMVEFSRSNTLQFHWMRFLPIPGRTFSSNPLWRELSSSIIQRLQREQILYPESGRDGPRLPEELRTLPGDYLDIDGSPLFTDRPGRNRKYLSLSYEPQDIEILRTAFGMKDIEDIHIYHRLKQDLDSPSSRMKADSTDDDWHTQTARLLKSILERSPRVGNMIKDLDDLIPLNGGIWTSPARRLYLPPATGPAIPQGLFATIDSQAASNPSRKQLFRSLGATPLSPETVIELLWLSYSRDNGAISLADSKAHLGYLFWHNTDENNQNFSRLWLYDHRLRPVKPRFKVIYLGINEAYSPRELLRSVPDPRDPGHVVWECPVAYVNDEYMDMFSSDTRRHGRSWVNWLQNVVGVRRVPQLKAAAGSLSTEMRHIFQYRPEKIIGMLHKHWQTYRLEITEPITRAIKDAEVTCVNGQREELSCTYFPSPCLTSKVEGLGIREGFPFLEIPGPAEDRSWEDWTFLTRFGVKSEAYLNHLSFDLDILQHHRRLAHQSWDSGVRNGIVRTYELIADHSRYVDREMLMDEFNEDSLILHPRTFRRSETAASWLDLQDAVWRGPENLIDKTPLASVAAYRNNEGLERLFCVILGIRNANWNDYMDMILKLRRDQLPPPDLARKIEELYQLLSQARLADEDWESIFNAFQDEQLVYVPSVPGWFSPSQCVWESPVPIPGKAIINTSYSDDFEPFFLERLNISPASLSTLVEGLRSLAQGRPSIDETKRMIEVINGRDPTESDLESLKPCNILPVRSPSPTAERMVFLNTMGNFVVTDRVKLSDIFRGHASFLDFTLEDVRRLDPFMGALGLKKKYLSLICTEETACNGGAEFDRSLTEDFKDRVYGLLRCAVSNRSQPALRSPQLFYDRLFATTVFRSNGISTQHTIRWENGDTVGPISGDTSYLHIREHDDSWQILVPENEQHLEICYSRQLPDAFSKLFEISSSAREDLGSVLRSSIANIDALLDDAGVANVPGFENRRRRDSQDGQGLEISASEEETPPLTNASRRESFSNDIENAIARLSVDLSEQPPTPSSSGFEEPGIRQSVPPNILLPRSPSPDQRFDPDSAYRGLLENVIRKASQISIPRCDAEIAFGDAQFHEGYDHEAAFGVRSQAQMNHDTKIGAAGELFVFELLLRFLDLGPPSSGWDMWRSTIRREAIIHPRYRDMPPWPGRHETSDIVFEDTESTLTSLFINAGYLDEELWAGAHPKYFIEVKATTKECGDRFFMSRNQLRMMRSKALVEGRVSDEIYVVCRVYNLGRENLNVKIYLDPAAHDRDGSLVFKSYTWTVTPRR